MSSLAPEHFVQDTISIPSLITNGHYTTDCQCAQNYSNSSHPYLPMIILLVFYILTVQT